MKLNLLLLSLFLASCGDITCPDCGVVDYNKIDSIVVSAVSVDNACCDTSDMFLHFMETYKSEVNAYWSSVAENAINKILYSKDSANVVLNGLWDKYHTTIDSFGRVHFFDNTIIYGKEGMNAVAKFDSTGKPVLIIQ